MMEINFKEALAQTYESLWQRIYESALAKQRQGWQAYEILEFLLAEANHSYTKQFSHLPLLTRAYSDANITFDAKGMPDYKLIVSRNQYQFVPWNLRWRLSDRLKNYVRSNNFDYIIELGSGPGWHLFDLYLSCPDSPAQFVACELSEWGLKCSELLFQKSHKPLLTQKFDFNAPDFSFLKEASQSGKKVLAFSSHAIEQIPKIPQSLFTDLIRMTEELVCVHAEPLAWQKNLQCRADYANGTDLAFEPIELNNSKINQQAYAWARMNNYNYNLLSTLEDLESKNLIQIQEFQENIIGMNPLNPESWLVWQKN